jgi:hypothetical protein
MASSDSKVLTKFLQAAAVLLSVVIFVFNNADGASALKLPSKESKFDGFYGIKVKKGIRCPKCCDLVFPETFGLGNMQELQFLEDIVSRVRWVKSDLDCTTAWDYDTLDHLIYLATVRQDRQAAKMLLTPPSQGGFDLGGGELDEVYGDEYVRPVVEKYNKLGELLNEKVMAYVAQELCLAWFNPVIDSTIDITKLTADLRKRNLNVFAIKIEATCKKLESEIKTRGE